MDRTQPTGSVPAPGAPGASTGRGAAIRLDRVTKRYDDGTVAVHELSIEIAAGTLVTLVGPSGCGKTTTMKMVNRLIEPTSGRILIDDEDVTSVDPVALRRRMGYVIQQAGLFPHRTVLDNVTTVPVLVGWDKSRARSRAKELLELVGLDPDRYAKRYPHELSGGQQQRVGVARALAADPPVLLMDEPFGAVDPITRMRLQQEFSRLQAELGKTVLFVTHDIDEAVRLGQRIAVFAQGGRLEQYDTPAKVLGVPGSDFVADFVGADRLLTRLSVTYVQRQDVERQPSVYANARLADAAAELARADVPWGVVTDRDGSVLGWLAREDARGAGYVRDRFRPMTQAVMLGTTVREALSVLLSSDDGWVAVTGPDGEVVGVLTSAGLHQSLRRSVDADLDEIPLDEVEVRSVDAL